MMTFSDGGQQIVSTDHGRLFSGCLQPSQLQSVSTLTATVLLRPVHMHSPSEMWQQSGPLSLIKTYSHMERHCSISAHVGCSNNRNIRVQYVMRLSPLNTHAEKFRTWILLMTQTDFSWDSPARIRLFSHRYSWICPKTCYCSISQMDKCQTQNPTAFHLFYTQHQDFTFWDKNSWK